MFSLRLYKEKQKRKHIVSQQIQIEQNIIDHCHKAKNKSQDKQAAAVFFVEDLPTPMFIPLSALAYNPKKQAWCLSDDTAIPEGLLPQDKWNQSEQLQTVLSRVATIHEMLAHNVNIMVFYVNGQRRKCHDDQAVDASHIDELKSEFPRHIAFHQIDKETYQCYQNHVSAATYCYGDPVQLAHVEVSQCHQPSNKALSVYPFKTYHQAVRANIDKLDELLIDNNFPNMELLAKASKIVRVEEQIEPAHIQSDNTEKPKIALR